MTDKVQSILEQREKVYGCFKTKALLIQKLKSLFRASLGYSNLDADMKESLDNIAQKIGRILQGNPDHKDSWVDIAGYAMLIANRLEDK